MTILSKGPKNKAQRRFTFQSLKSALTQAENRELSQLAFQTRGGLRLTKKSTTNSFKKTRPIEAPAAGKIAMTPAGLEHPGSVLDYLLNLKPNCTYPEGEKIWASFPPALRAAVMS